MFEFQPAQDSFSEVLRTRRTVNDFLSTPVSAEPVLQAIDLARWAPNHKLTEPWRFHLLGPRTVEQIIALNLEIMTTEKGAEAARKKMDKWAKIPGWIIVTCQKSPEPVRDLENYAAVSCAIQNLMLSLWSRKIGTKWATSPVLQDPRIARLLNVDPAAQRIVGLIWYGYPAVHAESRRHPVSEITIQHP